MIDFEFVSPTKIYFGNNKEELIGQICLEGGYKRVYIVIGQGSVKRNGLLKRVTDSLDKSGIKYKILEGVRPNPTIDLCHTGIKEAQIFTPNLILAIGGGSVIDTAKILRLVISTLVIHSTSIYTKLDLRKPYQLVSF